MYPDTRGRISTDSTGSSRPVNSSHSFTSFSLAVTTFTGNGGEPLFAGDLLQLTTIRDTAANAATVNSRFTLSRSCDYTLKNASNSSFTCPFVLCTFNAARDLQSLLINCQSCDFIA